MSRMVVQSESRQHVWAGSRHLLRSTPRSRMRTKLPLTANLPTSAYLGLARDHTSRWSRCGEVMTAGLREVLNDPPWAGAVVAEGQRQGWQGI